MNLSYAAPLTEGFLLGAGLIIGIGPQNAVVLRQGLKRQHLLAMVVVCTLLDVSLIALGTFGVSKVASHDLRQWLTFVGVAFLLYYGACSFASVFKAPARLAEVKASRQSVVVTLLVVSLLNPSVYLDTLFLIGGSASHYQDELRLMFALGAALASLLWFLSLSYGAATLAPLFKNRVMLRFLDALSGALMWLTALRLVQHVL
jgi:L-lysine exporter family protein LysE/ArgO